MIFVDGSKFSLRNGSPITVLSTSEPSPQQSVSTRMQKPTGKDKKCVAFDLKRNVYYKNRLYSKDEINDLGLWYKPEDFEAFKLATLKAVRLAERKAHEKGNYIETMDGLHKLCVNVSSSKRLFSVPLHILKDEDVIKFLGLDQWLLPGYAEGRETRKREVYDAVFSLSEAEHKDADERDALICHAARRISQPAKVFAGVVARTRALVGTSK